MRRLLMATAILAMATGVAFAGPNAGVVLSVHGDQVGVVTDGLAPCAGVQIPATCEELNPSAVAASDGVQTYLVVVVSPLANTPNFNTVVFGMGAYTPYVEGVIAAFGSCVPGALPVSTNDLLWPGPGEGMALSWAPGCLNGYIEPVYAFHAYMYGGVIPLAPHPTNASGVVDCSADPVLDGFDGYGELEGTNPDCPGEIEEPGACCFGPTCVMCLEFDCVDQLGVWYGPEVCGPDGYPCPQEPTPTKETTWGSIKNIYN